MKHAPGFLHLVEDTMPRITEITPEAVRTLQDESAPFILIDVREDHEWNAGRIKGAIHLGRGIIERDIEAKIPARDTKLVLYCGGGYRSALSADSLQKMGYTNVLSLQGGWREWKEKSYPQEA